MNVDKFDNRHGSDQKEECLGDVAERLDELHVGHVTEGLFVQTFVCEHRMCVKIGLEMIRLYERYDILRSEGIDDPEHHAEHERGRRLVDTQRMLESYPEVADYKNNDKCSCHWSLI